MEVTGPGAPSVEGINLINIIGDPQPRDQTKFSIILRVTCGISPQTATPHRWLSKGIIGGCQRALPFRANPASLSHLLAASPLDYGSEHYMGLPAIQRFQLV